MGESERGFLILVGQVAERDLAEEGGSKREP